jgi:MFS family permease
LKVITRTVWILSIVSLLTDTASEMLYPIMPIYLKSIGFSVLLIGLLEGAAEATAGLSKGYFGKLSDLSGKRVPFVRIGYSLSAVSKPLMAAFTFPLWLFFARTADRLGKGFRTGARDAILSDQATPSTKGKVFGFHRAMDTLGAVIGPSLALVYLYYYPQQYKALFFIAFVPGLLAILSTLFLREKSRGDNPLKVKTHFFSFLKYWRTGPSDYRKLCIGLLVFTLFNSSDVFLLLKMKEAGVNDTMVIGVYIFYNLVYALFSFPMGYLADKIGMKTIFVFGLVVFSAVYFGMAVSGSLTVYFVLFLLYGIYASATEGISKAWITNITDKKETATAIGTYSGLQSLFTLLASSLTGVIWFTLGATVAFSATAVITLAVAFYMSMLKKPPTV